jgi:hypothetical protein
MFQVQGKKTYAGQNASAAQVVGPAFEPRSMAKQLKLFGTV